MTTPWLPHALGLDTERYAERWRGPVGRPPGSPWGGRPRRLASAHSGAGPSGSRSGEPAREGAGSNSLESMAR
jgi:hypothetical protein